MNKMLILAAGVIALAGCDNSKPAAESKPPIQTADAGCPTPEEIHSAVTQYIQRDYWNTRERETWKITDVDGFTFSEIETGNIIKKVVDFSSEKDVCPVRVTYTFRVHHQDGRVETKEMGVDKTHLFYKDGFNAWTFRIS